MVNEQNIKIFFNMIISIIKQFNNRNNLLIITLFMSLLLVKINTREGNMVNDTISDLLTRIRNANLARHDTVDILNKMNYRIRII
jgi:hypothetical protein